MPDKILSSRYKNVFSLEEQISLSKQLKNKKKYFYNDKAYQTLSASVIEQLERNSSTKYRFNFSLNSFFSNVLFNITGTDSYDTVLEKRNFITQEGEYEYSLNEILKNSFGKYYYNDLNSDTQCDNNFLRPYPDDLSFLSNTGFQNYDIFLSYAASKDDTFEFNNIPLSDGLSIFSSSIINYAGRQMTKLFINVAHNLSTGDIIRINDTDNYTVYALGDENQDNKSHIFIIDNQLTLSNAYFTKFTNNVKSQYYFRKYKRLNIKLDLFKTAFSNSIYNDQCFSLSSADADLKDIKDCFDRDVNEIYLSIIKKRATSYSPTFFTNPILGLDNLVANSKYDINSININDATSFIEQINSGQEEFYGDIIEYNPINQTIDSLITVNHVFNSVNRNENNYLEGYYYKPFYKIQIKSFSEFIETYNENPPQSAYKIHNTRYVDRPLLNNSDADLYPFLNGFHYVHGNINFYLKRQDACYQYMLESNEPIVKGDCKNFVDQEFKIGSDEC